MALQLGRFRQNIGKSINYSAACQLIRKRIDISIYKSPSAIFPKRRKFPRRETLRRYKLSKYSAYRKGAGPRKMVFVKRSELESKAFAIKTATPSGKGRKGQNRT